MKKIITTSAILAMALAMTACSKEDSKTSSVPATPAVEAPSTPAVEAPATQEVEAPATPEVEGVEEVKEEVKV